MKRQITIPVITLSLLLGLGLWSQWRGVKAKAALAATAMPMTTATAARGQTELPPALRAAVEKSRYRIRPPERAADAGAYHAANPAQELRAGFSRAGLSVRPHTTPAKTWQWGMQLQGYGYGERMQRVAPAEPVVADNRIEYRRGALTEWYINERRGIEQGFTLLQPPAGRRSASEPLALRLNVSGDLRAEASGDGQRVWFVQGGGERVLGYSKLAAFDAAGQRLAARMRVAAGAVRLEVDDRGAAYPVLIDPLIFTETKLTASDAAFDDWFGHSVAISGDTAVVGAPGNGIDLRGEPGSAYVYVRSGTTWSEQAHFFASDAEADDFFGSSVAISGDTAVVGAPGDGTAAGSKAGSAYVYVRSGTTWSEQAHLFASDAAAYDNFGSSVAISGDTAVVGAPGDSSTIIEGRKEGSAYVYVRSGTTWSEQAHFFASNAVPFNFFGDSVAIVGDTAVVGVPGDDTAAGESAGSAYIYVRGGTTWSEQAHLFASDAAAYDNFGSSVAISGETIVVGANRDSTAAGMETGSAYVYVRSGATWGEQARLFASDAAAYDHFGYSAAITGETIVVGARFDDTAAGMDAGSAYVYVRSGTTWSEQAHLFASDTAAGDFFGISVAISGETIVVGAPRDDIAAGVEAGSAYVYAPGATADLELSNQDSPDPVTTGQNLTYTLTLTNRGPAAASNVVVTDNLPASTTLVSCSADQGGVCSGTGNNRTITFASLAPNATATITIIARVNCNVSHDTLIRNTASVTSDTSDPNPLNNSATAQTTASNPPPVITSNVTVSSLGSPNSDLVNAGLTASATDNCPGPFTFQVLVFGDEDDQTPTSPGASHSPDAKDIALGTLRLRSERVVSGDGRVYLIVVKTTDSGGRVGFSVNTVVVAKSQSQADIDAVNNQAAAAKAFALANGGNPPAGYFVIGDGPVIGPKQ